MEAGLTPEASREYADLLTEIRTVDAEISSPEYENQLAFYQNMREQLKGVIESTQAEKQALVEQVEKGRKFIANGGFSDLESVRKYEKKADSLYASHEALIRETRRKSRRILPGVALLLAVLCAGAAGFLFSAGWAEHKVYLAACVINAAISAALGLWLLGKNRRLLSALEETDAALKELLSRHLGDGTISAEAMKAFQGRMAEFSRLCGIVVRSEGEVRQFMEKIASLQTKQNSCSEMIEKQQRIQWELEKKLEYVNHCKTQARALKRVLVENERINEEIAAVEMAQKVMTDLSFSIRDSFGLYLNKEASEFIREITGGIYDSMSVDENLNVFLNTKTKLAPIESVSSGTMDQVYLALRLAAAKLLAGGKETMPLLFDDSFTQYDDERLSAALKWLAASYGGQMIFFTCHRREADFLRAADVRFHLIEL